MHTPEMIARQLAACFTNGTWEVSELAQRGMQRGGAGLPLVAPVG